MFFQVYKGSQPARTRRVTQLAQRLALNLPDAFARNLKALAHFFQRTFGAVFQAKTHPDDLLLTRVEGPQNFRCLLLQIHADHCIRGGHTVGVLEEVNQPRAFIFPDRCLERDWLLRDFLCSPNLGDGYVHSFCDLLDPGLTAEFLDQQTRGTDKLVDYLYHVYRNADGARLVSNGARHRLANPPG